MTTRAEAFAGPFPAGPEWAAAARSKLGLDGGDDRLVGAVAQGWMRLGSTRDATLVDTLFVLSDDRLGFGQTRFETTDPNWVELSAVHAMDLIEGVPYPLDAVEVQFVNGLAIFVGWPEDFTTAVLTALRAHGTPPAMAPLFAPEPRVEGTDDMGGLTSTDGGAGLPFAVGEDLAERPASEPARLPAPERMLVEPPVAAVAAVAPVLAEAPVADDVTDVEVEADRVADEDDVSEEAFPGDDQGFEPTAELRLAEEMFFGHLEADDHPTADSEEAASGESVDLPAAAAAQVAGPWDDQDIAWPDAFRDCAFLGGHPIHQRRRKTCAVVLERRGIIAAAPRAGAWHLHVPWSDVARIDVQGPDEIKFTHNQRIGGDGSVLVVDLADDTSLLFEVRGMRPATLRAAVAGAQEAVGRIDAP